MAINVENNSIWSIIADGRLFGQQVMLTTHWKMEQDDPMANYDYQSSATEIINWFDDLASGPMKTLCTAQSTDMAYPNIFVQALYSQRLIRWRYEPANSQGTVASTAGQSNTAGVVTMRGDLALRTNIADKHIGGMPQIRFADGGVNGVGQADLDLIGIALETPSPSLTVGGHSFVMTPVIFHRAVPTLSVLITNHVVQQTARTMRRRGLFLGS